MEKIFYFRYDLNIEIMAPGTSGSNLKELILKAIDDHELSRAEHEEILHLALEDGHIDNHERALLEQLQDMIENKTIRIVK